MRRILLKAAVLLSLALAASPALAEPRQGGYEAGVGLGGMFVSDKIDDLVAVHGNVLAYYTDQVAVGGRVQLGFGGDTAFSLLGEARYHLPQTNDVTPYVGALFGPSFIDANGDSATSLTLGAVAGVKKYMAKDWALFGEVQMGFLIGEENANYFGLGVGALLPF